MGYGYDSIIKACEVITNIDKSKYSIKKKEELIEAQLVELRDLLDEGDW
jgi:hypothetical protein